MRDSSCLWWPMACDAHMCAHMHIHTYARMHRTCTRVCTRTYMTAHAHIHMQPRTACPHTQHTHAYTLSTCTHTHVTKPSTRRHTCTQHSTAQRGAVCPTLACQNGNMSAPGEPPLEPRLPDCTAAAAARLCSWLCMLGSSQRTLGRAASQARTCARS